MKITITVTERHIERGEGIKIDGCALAIALNEQIPTCKATVGAALITLSPLLAEGNYVLINQPASARRFRQEFDIHKVLGGKCPKPFKFQLEVPDELLSAEPQRTQSVMTHKKDLQPVGQWTPTTVSQRDLWRKR